MTTREQCAQDAIQALADYYGPQWEQIRDGFGKQAAATEGGAAQPAA